jgi:Secretion system C-terminal sorting domain
MSDEMSYLQAEILDVINRIDTTHSDLTVNLGSVFYRDNGDDYLAINKGFTKNISSAVDYIKEQRTGGGGDFPEAVDAALDMAINDLKWSDNARARIIFLVLDAPPHNDTEVVEKLQKLTQLAAEKGIRIVPITCSGVDKSTEYLMRSMALATNGTYVFLTDDSGIGGSHIKPTTDKWEVEFLNDLIVRLINQYVVTPTCDNQITVDEQDLQQDTVLVNFPNIDTNFVDIDTVVVDIDTVTTDSVDVAIIPPVEQTLKIYPNPTSGNLTIEVTGEINEFYVCDFSGKILERHETELQSEIRIFIGTYPPGIYFVRYFVGEILQSGKVILMY